MHLLISSNARGIFVGAKCLMRLVEFLSIALKEMKAKQIHMEIEDTVI